MVANGILHVIFHMVAEEWLSVPDHLSLLRVDRLVLTDLDLVRQLGYLRLYREDIAEAERIEEDDRRTRGGSPGSKVGKAVKASRVSSPLEGWFWPVRHQQQ